MFSALISLILLYISTLFSGFDKPSTDFGPGENPSRIRGSNPFSNLFRRTNNHGPDRTQFQRDQRQNFYTQRSSNNAPKGPGLNNCLGGG